jgi:hypothetical protein
MTIRNPFEPDRLKLTDLEAENARLRRMAADLSAHVSALQAAAGGARGDERADDRPRQLRLARRSTDLH